MPRSLQLEGKSGSLNCCGGGSDGEKRFIDFEELLGPRSFQEY